MDNHELLRALAEAISKLQEKINIISDISDNGNEKVANVKKQTLERLYLALDKIKIKDQNNIDVHQLESGILALNEGSKQLFDNALNAINQFKKEEAINKELKNNFSKAIDQTSIGINNTNIKPDDYVSKQAIEILKEWLMPEGD